jgi:hypothetical protein
MMTSGYDKMAPRKFFVRRSPRGANGQGEGALPNYTIISFELALHSNISIFIIKKIDKIMMVLINLCRDLPCTHARGVSIQIRWGLSWLICGNIIRERSQSNGRCFPQSCEDF